MGQALDQFIQEAVKQDARNLAELSGAQISSYLVWKQLALMMSDTPQPEEIRYTFETRQLAYFEWFRLLGEAAKRLPKAIKGQHDVDWQEISQLRDAAAHWEIPEYHQALKNFVRRQKELAPHIERVHHEILGMRTDQCSEQDANQIRDLQLGMNMWTATNAFHFGETQAFLDRLPAGQRDLYKDLFSMFAVADFKGAFNSLQVKSGNLAAAISHFFRDACGEESGYNHLSFVEIRNTHAHFDHTDVATGERKWMHTLSTYDEQERKGRKAVMVDSSGFREWVERVETPENLFTRYRDHLLRSLSDEAKQVIEKTALKLKGNRTLANAKQQQAFLISVADLGRDIEPATLEKVVDHTLALATVKQKNMNLQTLPKKLPGQIAPFAQRLLESMKERMMIRDSVQIAD